MDKTFLSTQKLKEIAKTFTEPFFIYDEAGIREAHERVTSAFSFSCGFRQYFPICRTTPPQFLNLLHEMGSGVCCFDEAQLRLCVQCGFTGEELMFAPTLANAAADKLAADIGCIRVISTKQIIPECPPKHAMLVYNPGGKLVRNNTVFTTFSRMKWGMEREELAQFAEHLLRYGTQSVGIMLPACTNELRSGYFPAVAQELFSLAVYLREKDIHVCSCNLAGGLGINGKHKTQSIDLETEAQSIRLLAESFGLSDLVLQTVLGKYILAPNALFLTQVAAVLPHERPLIITRASADCLPEASPLGTYHHISALTKSARTELVVADVAGSQNDLRRLFAEKRVLPQVKEDDWLVFHSAGLTSPPLHACPQVLYRTDGSITAW